MNKALEENSCNTTMLMRKCSAADYGQSDSIEKLFDCDKIYRKQSKKGVEMQYLQHLVKVFDI